MARAWSHSPHRPQSRPQRGDLIEQFQRQCRSREINLKIPLQAHGHSGAVQAGAAEYPAGGFTALGFQYAHIHQLDYPFFMDGTGPTEIGQRQLGLLFQYADGKLWLTIFSIHFSHPHFGAWIEIQFLSHFPVKRLGRFGIGWR